MPTRGNPLVCLRLTPETMDQVDEAIVSANATRYGTPYDRVSWIRQAIREKLKKLRRGRGERVGGMLPSPTISEPPGETPAGEAVPYAGDPLAGDQE